MINGFFLMRDFHLPLSQVYKTLIIGGMFFRLIFIRDFLFLLIILFVFQIAPFAGFLKTGNISGFFKDIIVATKWISIPISFFYFKALFQANYFHKIYPYLKFAIGLAIFWLSINMILGAAGLGMSFYFHGYGNAVGTKGFIYAGNELTILVLTLGFLLACYLKQKKNYLSSILMLFIFLLFSFLITSKTVLGGVLIVFLIPWISRFSRKLKYKWLKILLVFIAVSIPVLIGTFYFGITQSGFLDKLKTSKKMNEGNFLETLLSNRNNFLIDGWRAFTENYNLLEQIVGLGQTYYVNLVDSIPELDFFTLLFTNGIIGLLTLLFIIYYWFVNTNSLSRFKKYSQAESVKIFLLFIIIIANLAGHIFSSAVAGFFIGLSIAIMFFNEESLPIVTKTD